MFTSGSSHTSRLSASLGAVCLLSFAGCVREPLDLECSPVPVGALVITEIRGPQPGSYKQWIEVYNAGDAAIQLIGLHVVFTRNDGSGAAFFVRDDLELAPGAYATLGGADLQDRPYIDYDYTLDYFTKDPETDEITAKDLYGAAALELRACGVVVDTVHYSELPGSGSLALDGAVRPDAATNDDARPPGEDDDEPTGWCVDAREGDGPQTEVGIRGTPQEANPPCV